MVVTYLVFSAVAVTAFFLGVAFDQEDTRRRKISDRMAR